MRAVSRRPCAASALVQGGTYTPPGSERNPGGAEQQNAGPKLWRLNGKVRASTVGLPKESRRLKGDIGSQANLLELSRNAVTLGIPGGGGGKEGREDPASGISRRSRCEERRDAPGRKNFRGGAPMEVLEAGRTSDHGATGPRQGQRDDVRLLCAPVPSRNSG